ncbi:uncharacterized protein PGTG_05125 [Puccinia graminis f. sp. tritici CRL 75-36-700-3]|uniref:Uncharacterized protein n=1 Tax=Puccinia graminis f. sp. tritici (strain CRL 75-36-700-3 / race SCCL) TaxID=418459 RepID=E3K6K3_PUCGT|nr:uncharacterized protein PGTG_05125 [Puccinia graminis f. sp. tritici CRL 75-36-700-3]EFP79900.2 hypothetical protein PGTG_05125 [Puccinia graminis f. sp. tritici CRL 75-36-700-3]
MNLGGQPVPSTPIQARQANGGTTLGPGVTGGGAMRHTPTQCQSTLPRTPAANRNQRLIILMQTDTILIPIPIATPPGEWRTPAHKC